MGCGWSRMLGVCALVLMAPAASRANESLTARAAIVVDAHSGKTIWERAADIPLPPASTTKVLTAILALESGRLDESFRVSAEAASTEPSKIGLREGQHMRLRDLLYAVLLNSANDAAAVVAEGLAGSEAAFAVQMNARARALGALNSHFVNPHGLTDIGHLTTARDLATIFQHGLGIPLFRDILETRAIQVHVEAPNARLVSLRSHNRLLTGYAYPVIGKTGYTRPARRCFVGAAEHGDQAVIVALLGSRDLWGDTKKLLALGLGEPTLRGLPRRQPILQARRPARKPVRMARHGPSRHAEGDDESLPQVPEARAAANHRFAVEVGPYPNRAQVQVAYAKLTSRGYGVEETGHVLRVGSFASRTRAARLASRLRVSGFRSRIVSLD